MLVRRSIEAVVLFSDCEQLFRYYPVFLAPTNIQYSPHRARGTPVSAGSKSRANLQPTLERKRTMKRNLIVVAALGLALSANAVLADNNWAFDDAYWKQGETVQSVQSTQATVAQGRYDQVDRYNP